MKKAEVMLTILLRHVFLYIASIVSLKEKYNNQVAVLKLKQVG